MLEQNIQDELAFAHEHVNLALLETYTQTEVDLLDAVSLKHAQNTDTILQGSTPLVVPQALVDDSYLTHVENEYWGAQSFLADKTGTLDTVDV